MGVSTNHIKSMTTFDVRGRYPFPLDMLRYDSCWPTRQHDVSEMLVSLSFGLTTQIVNITSVNMMGPTIERWASFGWEVIIPSVQKRRL